LSPLVLPVKTVVVLAEAKIDFCFEFNNNDNEELSRTDTRRSSVLAADNGLKSIERKNFQISENLFFCHLSLFDHLF
jgi:hypothetical protein